MADQLSSYMRERIARLSEERKSVAEIVAILETEGRKVSHTTVRKWIFRWQSNHGLKDQHRSGRPTKVTADIAAFIESKLEEDDEITSVELQSMVAEKATFRSAPDFRHYNGNTDKQADFTDFLAGLADF